MPYTVDPNDPLTPTDGDGATQGAEELRDLKNTLNGSLGHGTVVALASATWGVLFDTATLPNNAEVELYVNLAGGGDFPNYGVRAILYKDTGPANYGKLISPALAEIRINGTNLEYFQQSGLASDVEWKLWGNKARTIA